MKIEPGCMVLVVGPTVGGGSAAVGFHGVVGSYVHRGEPTISSFKACADGWFVQLARPADWGPFSLDSAVFPASSLMPIGPSDTAEDTGTDTPVECDIAHA